ncbi:flavin reductase family protein [Shimia haliotis]|uniref:NADH-FMN oxidoreductase RutF, flavin reductase (DIM6/NTAB) family n=1 Tax=Shimia haliotis TaxID=1280847 RepID=A0A1I4FM35_9RHOB|nr:flavin reductase family protein [Shimia haliotis]SFL18975.1 NADH-FMN oxidoreductase RutF, flavin reductase (DIM6/NTAB) family [Shimia haliotis]
MTDIDPRALRTAFGAFMTGVTVVTAKDGDNAPLGFTANSFTSVSLNPPLVLVCLANSSSNYDALVAAEGFAVNVLSETQMDVSNTFARPAEDRFADVGWRDGPQGAPILDGVSAWFDCRMHKVTEAGDHVILIGEVCAFDSTAAPGLGYVRGAYVTPSMAAQAASQATDLAVTALIEHEGHVLLVDDTQGGMMLPETLATSGEGASAAVARLLQATCPSAKAGFVYSVYEDPKRGRQHIAFLCQAAEPEAMKGTFVPLSRHALDDISDPAMLTMLERFSAESAVGEFGIYYGDQSRGEVRAIV